MRGHLHGAFAAAFLVPAAAAAFETIPMRLEGDDPADAWNSATTCNVMYYNTCTDWVLAWGAWSGDVFGMAFDGCCGDGHTHTLEVSRHYLIGVAPWYGFTGTTVAVYAADENLCPTGEPLATRRMSNSIHDVGWRGFPWYSLPVPDPFVITMTIATHYPCYVVTDRPSARRPGDPRPCGLCYPVSRANHTFRYGTATAPYCPGEPLDGGPCDAQLLWEVGLSCGSIAVDGTSWGQIKALYR
jgi:hypothetical protein